MANSDNYKNTIAQELSSFSNSEEFSYTSIFDKIYGYRYPNYTDDYAAFAQFKKEQSDIYFDRAINEYEQTLNQQLKNEIQDIALTDLNRRYDVLIRLGDRDSFEVVLKNAEDFLKGKDYLYDHGYQYEDGQVLFDLIQAYYNLQFQEDVVSFFNRAFNFAKKYAIENKKWEYLSGDPDESTALTIAQAITWLKKDDREKFASVVFDIYTFCSHDERGYEVNQASGYIALLLTIFDSKIDINILNHAINITGEYYQDNTFVHQTLYSKWILANDSKGAFSYLQSEENRRGFIFAIIALADLNDKETLPFLEKMLKEEKNPVIIEVLNEAIERLNTQITIPETENRMIWLNGNLTPTQRALGAESDNIFVKRAQERTGLDDIVYETDDD
ncbi:hypothetical protein GCM10011506_35210 [Marivirga lumbricoides]|uniref:HEAT repeat domain-containing protein n=1 Tax=Marivirga lumbricoides TaxID=1046115 RepID=A0ABQ1MTR4_9BACT|nr:hypothetical protein GCM10011506_35210 [Marivirga lumbricoides]